MIQKDKRWILSSQCIKSEFVKSNNKERINDNKAKLCLLFFTLFKAFIRVIYYYVVQYSVRLDKSKIGILTVIVNSDRGGYEIDNIHKITDIDNNTNYCIHGFNMFDFIGGRYSVTSAVGGLPLSLAFGFDTFHRFLKGCHKMDLHALNAQEEKNIPLMAALISIWNSNFLDYTTLAIIPYCTALSNLCPHVQQLYMESLGKGVNADGKVTNHITGVIIFGEPGTNAQHSFFQLAHQGSPFPIEFIGVVNPVYNKAQAISNGVSNHQELWANMIAQAMGLAKGKMDDNNAKCFSGNRPSSTLLINDLTPESIGMLLAFYEARTVYEGFILGLNPFDQFGVELGKVLAGDIRDQIKRKNTDKTYNFNSLDTTTKFYLDILFKGSL